MLITSEISNQNRVKGVENMHIKNLNMSKSFRMIWSTLGKVIINVIILYVFIGRPFGENL